jgi:hypothetical protein
MAIQVGGTTVINDSRTLQNVGGLKTVGGNSILGSGDISVGGGAPNYNGGRTSGYTFTGTMPVGATVLADAADSKLSSTAGTTESLGNHAQYGASYSMTGGTNSSSDNFLLVRGSNSAGTGVINVYITYGTWQVMNAHQAVGNAAIICLRTS